LKKRSARKRSGRQPDLPILFVDRCLGRAKIPDAIRALGIRVEVHTDHFEPDADDIEILRTCGERGWTFLTKDQRITRDPAEVAAPLDAGIHAIFLSRQSVSAEAIIAVLSHRLPALVRRLASQTQPVHLVLRMSGDVVRLELRAAATKARR